MRIIECRTQAELDAAIEKNDSGARIVLRGDASFRFIARGSARVVARGSAHVVAWDSAHVVARDSAHVVARDSAHVVARDSAHVVARDSAHVVARDSAHVVARDSAHVVARDSAHVEAWGNALLRVFSGTIKAAMSVVVMLHGAAKATGGQQVKAVSPETAKDWCEFHGVTVKRGIATLYKAVRDDFKSQHGGDYTPGTMPVASDWDGGDAECGGGLHFSPTPACAKTFDSSATRYVACQVRIKDMRAPQAGDNYPDKIKAKGCCAPCVEVDIRGNPVAAGSAA